MRQVTAKLERKEALSDEELMKLIILPLTYKGKERKEQAVREAVELAKRIEDGGEKSFVLSGILVFADKIISAKMAKYIKEVLKMTQVAQLLMEEGRQEGRQARGQAIPADFSGLEEIEEKLRGIRNRGHAGEGRGHYPTDIRCRPKVRARL